MSRPKKRTKPTRLFISHAAKDSKFVVKLTTVLASSKIKYWFSKQHIRGAQQWHDEIGTALKKCDWFAVVLTPNSVRSKWVKRELLYALQRDKLRDRILPLLVKKCKYNNLSWTLDSFQMIDFRRNFQRGCRELLRMWNVKFKL